MPVKIQLRRGTAAQWTAADPLLAHGELGVELDTGKYKLGNGTQSWSALAYSSGPQGDSGTQGPQGNDGAQGPQGDSGGPQGDQGYQGPQGNDGVQGAQGPQGADGAQGVDGQNGAQGPQGDQGAQGSQGNQGAQAVAGLIPTGYVEVETPTGTTSETLEDVTGASATITTEASCYLMIHSSFEVATQSGAAASIIGIALNINGTDHEEYKRYLSGTNDTGIGAISHRTGTLSPGTHTVKLRFRRVSGTATPGINRLDLMIVASQSAIGPQGDQGDQGAQGNDGSQGAQGDQGPQGDQGNQGPQGEPSLIQGPQGDQGNQGFTGPPGEASTIPGPQGDQGPQGNDGAQGVPGADSYVPGPQGEQGHQGTQGDQGPQGDPSMIPGPQGDQGNQGNQGDQGDAGADSTVPGPQGNQGNQGDQGHQGDAGPQGNQGNQGDQGDAGAQGDQGDQGNQGNQGNQGTAGAGSNIRVYTWVVSTPATGGILGPRLNEAHTVTRIDSYVAAATSVTFNIEERTSIGSAGTDLLSSDQVAVTTGASQTSSFNDSSLASGSWLYLDISAVSGTPGQVVVTLTCTV